MNFSSENFSENFSDIKYKEPTVFCDGLYCGIPMEKTFAKYENRNFTSTKSDFGFNAPVFNEKRSKKFKSLASELQRVQYTKDKRVFSPISSPSGFSDFEPIQGLFRDITLEGAIRSKQRGVGSSSKLSSSKLSSTNLSSNSSELKNSSVISKSQSTVRSTQRNTENTTDKSKLASSIVSSVYPTIKSSTLSSPSVPKKPVSTSTVSSVPTKTTKTTKPTIVTTTPSLSDVISKTSTTIKSSKKK